MARSQKDIVSEWQDKITTAKRFRDRKAEEFGWERFIKEYKGKYDVSLGSRRARISVPPLNHVFSYVQSDIASMYFRDPYITVVPGKRGEAKRAALWEVALNYYWRALKIKREIKSQMVDADLVGHAWNKDGYYLETEGDEEDFKIKSEQLYSMKVSWRDVVFNVSSINAPVDSAWIAHRIIKPLDQARAKYSGLAKMDGTFDPRLIESDHKDSLIKDDIKVVVLWEIYDKTNREIILIAEGHDKILKRIEWPAYMSEFPLSRLWYYENPDDPFPISPISVQEPQILEEIKLFAQALNHVKRWNRQAFIKKGTISEEDKDKYEEGIDGALIDVDGGPQDVRWTDYGQLPPDIYNLLNRLASYRSETVGQTEVERGGMARTNTRTLGELNAVSAGARGRQDARIDQLETHMETIARHLLGHIRNNFDIIEISKISGDTPQAVIEILGDAYDAQSGTVFFDPTGDEGEYDVQIKAGSTLPINKQTRMAILKEVLELAVRAPSPLPPFAKVVMMELLRDYQLPQIQEAFLAQEAQVAEQQMQRAEVQSVEDQKKVADTAKRLAQAQKTKVEADILELDTQRRHAVENYNAQQEILSK